MALLDDLLESLARAKKEEKATRNTKLARQLSSVILRNYGDRKTKRTVANIMEGGLALSAPKEPAAITYKEWTGAKKTSTTSASEKKDAADKPSTVVIDEGAPTKEATPEPAEEAPSKEESVTKEATPEPAEEVSEEDFLKKVPSMEFNDIVEHYGSIKNILAIAKKLEIVIRAKKPESIVSNFQKALATRFEKA